MMQSVFSCASWPFICLLWRNVYLDPLPIFQLGCFVFLLLSCVSWYILESKPLSFVSFSKIFSHSVSCLVFFLCVCVYVCVCVCVCVIYFAVQKCLSLIRPHWFIFVFIVIIPGGGWIFFLFSHFLKKASADLALAHKINNGNSCHLLNIWYSANCFFWACLFVYSINIYWVLTLYLVVQNKLGKGRWSLPSKNF